MELGLREEQAHQMGLTLRAIEVRLKERSGPRSRRLHRTGRQLTLPCAARAPVQAVSPGSDLHVILASQLHALQLELHGPGSQQAQQAWRAVEAAHRTRYGAFPDAATLERLAHLNATLYK